MPNETFRLLMNWKDGTLLKMKGSSLNKKSKKLPLNHNWQKLNKRYVRKTETEGWTTVIWQTKEFEQFRREEFVTRHETHKIRLLVKQACYSGVTHLGPTPWNGFCAACSDALISRSWEENTAFFYNQVNLDGIFPDYNYCQTPRFKIFHCLRYLNKYNIT